MIYHFKQNLIDDCMMIKIIILNAKGKYVYFFSVFCDG